MGSILCEPLDHPADLLASFFFVVMNSQRYFDILDKLRNEFLLIYSRSERNNVLAVRSKIAYVRQINLAKISSFMTMPF